MNSNLKISRFLAGFLLAVSATPAFAGDCGVHDGFVKCGGDRPLSKEAAAAAKREGVVVGMTPQEVRRSSWGRPRAINADRYAGTVREQWVYGEGFYLYFRDGRLTTISTRR